MASNSSALLNQLEKAASEAYKAGRERQSAELFLQAAELAEREGEERRRFHFLFLAGDSLVGAGEAAKAVPLLLQVVQEQEGADAADIFNAWSKLIAVAKVSQTIEHIRRLLVEARAFLARVGREAWRHKVLHLEAQLESARGEAQRAFVLEENALAVWTDSYPCFVKSNHLFRLCEVAFDLLDPEELAKRVEDLAANEPEMEGCRAYAGLGQLLLARCGGGRLSAIEAAELARSLVRRLESFELPWPEAWLGVARAFLVFGSWVEVERTLEKVTPLGEGGKFYLRICHGDFSLARAREALGLRRRDEQWNDEVEHPLPPFPSPEDAQSWLDAARRLYEEARSLAKREDERLETTYHHRQLENRLAKVAALEAALAEEV